MKISRTFMQRIWDTVLDQRWYQVEVELGDGILRRTTYHGRRGVITEVGSEQVSSK